MADRGPVQGGKRRLGETGPSSYADGSSLNARGEARRPRRGTAMGGENVSPLLKNRLEKKEGVFPQKRAST